MPKSTDTTGQEHQTRFIDSLTAFTKEHRARHWEGTFAEFLGTIVPDDARGVSRSSHEYVWDMLQWYGRREVSRNEPDGNGAPVQPVSYRASCSRTTCSAS